MTPDSNTAAERAPPPPGASASEFARPFIGLVAGLIGLAAAHAEGIPLNLAFAFGSVVLAITAHAGFHRMANRLGDKLPHDATTAHALLTVAAPTVFLLILVLGTDYLQRGALAWLPFAAGLPFALLAACLPLTERFAQREHDRAIDRNSFAATLDPSHAKLAYLGIALPAYGWLILQVGRYNLPQGCAAAALTLLLSFHAARILHEHATEADGLRSAVRFTALAAPLHGLILAAALVLDIR